MVTGNGSVAGRTRWAGDTPVVQPVICARVFAQGRSYILASDMVIIRDRPRLPVVNSKYLFQRLIDLYQADLLCDVGSFDGTHALMFARPGMKVVALEANPQAADAMANDRRLTDAGIEVHHAAAWNDDEQVPFNIISVPDGEAHAWRSEISSIRPRAAQRFDHRPVTVQGTRLDSFVSNLKFPTPTSIALWIDVEGVGFEALEGIHGIHKDVCVVHVEVEATQFWKGQYLWPDVAKLMRDLGFRAVARSSPARQFDVVFVNDSKWHRSRIVIDYWVLLSCARRRAGLIRGRIRRLLGSVQQH